MGGNVSVLLDISVVFDTIVCFWGGFRGALFYGDSSYINSYSQRTVLGDVSSTCGHWTAFGDFLKIVFKAGSEHGCHHPDGMETFRFCHTLTGPAADAYQSPI